MLKTSLSVIVVPSLVYPYFKLDIKVAEHSFAGGQRWLAWRRVF